eukprot:471310_1
MDKLKICRNRINAIKSYLSQSVLGVNTNSVEIQKPFGGSVVHGLRLQIYVSRTRVNDTLHRNLPSGYRYLLQNAINNGTFATVIQDSWRLTSASHIGNIQCKLVRLQTESETTFTNIG